MSLPANFRKRKHLAFAVILSLLLLTISPHVIYAQSTTSLPSSGYITPNTNNNVPQNLHTLVQALSIEVMSVGICQLSGIDIMNPTQGCLGIDSVTNKLGYAPGNTASGSRPHLGGLIGFTTDSMGSMYNMPIHTTDFTHYMASNFGLVKPAYAQADGFQQLNGLLKLWTIFRNITYMAFIIVFALIGVAIMLRVKADPRTVMTLQNQLPKVIIGLLMITFSYAIAGFLVDAMWTTTYLAVNLISSADPDINAKEVTANLQNNPIGYALTVFGGPTKTKAFQDGFSLGGLAKDVSGAAGDVVASIVSAPQFSTPSTVQGLKCGALGASALPTLGLSLLLGAGTGDLEKCIGIGVYAAIKFISAILIFLIVLAAIYIMLFRVWWMLLQCFIRVLLYTLVSPLYIFMGLFPGSTLGFGPWIRVMIANLLVFPAAASIFVLARVCADTLNSQPTGSVSFSPPLSNNPSAGIGPFIAFGFILLAPSLLTLIREALKAKPNQTISNAIFGGIGAGSAPAAAVSNFAWTKLNREATPYLDAGPLRSTVVNKLRGTQDQSMRYKFITSLAGKTSHREFEHFGAPRSNDRTMHD